MKKLFLTSGVILCMACPALATTDIDYSNGSYTAGGATPTCVEDITGQTEQLSTAEFEARWTPITYTIAYAKGTAGSHDAAYVTLGQSGLPDSNTPVTFDSTNIALASPTSANFTATGYHFAGWESPVDLTNGNAPTSPATYVLYQGTQASSPNGYYTGGTLASYGYANSAQNGTVTLNAHWVPNEYTVTYHTCASPMAGGSATGASNTATYDAAYSMPAGATVATTGTNAVATGYTFLGWTTDSTPSITRTGATAGTVANSWTAPSTWTTTNDVDVYAACIANQYTVTYDKGAHAAANVNNYVDTNGATFGENYTAKTFSQASMTEATGYTFAGWTTDPTPSFTNSVLDNAWTGATPWNSTSDLTVYAAYTANGHTISYSCGSNPTQNSQSSVSGSPTNTSVNIAYGGTYILPTTEGGCTLSGYHFGGWRCNYNLGSGDNTSTDYTSDFANNAYTVTATGTFNTDADVSCTVIWAKNEITLNWYNDTEDNNGTAISVSGTNAESCMYDDIIDLAPQPTKTGYTFTGWTLRQ